MSDEINKPATDATPGQWVPKEKLDEAICERDVFEAEIERLHQRIEDIGKAHAVALQLSQPHEPVGRTEYVVDLERRIARVEGLREWALSRVAHCAAIEEKYQKKTRYDIPIEPVEARQERRTLEAVLRIIEGKDA